MEEVYHGAFTEEIVSVILGSGKFKYEALDTWPRLPDGAKLIETPIHFKDRKKGKSKIPKLQIFISSFDLLIIKLKDIFKKYSFDNNNRTYNFSLLCNNCKNTFFTLVKKEKFKCLVCGRTKNKHE